MEKFFRDLSANVVISPHFLSKIQGLQEVDTNET